MQLGSSSPPATSARRNFGAEQETKSSDLCLETCCGQWLGSNPRQWRKPRELDQLPASKFTWGPHPWRDPNLGHWDLKLQDPGSGGSSGFDSDSGPNSVCGSCDPAAATRHTFQCTTHPVSNVPDFLRLGARPKTSMLDRPSPRFQDQSVAHSCTTAQGSRRSSCSLGQSPGQKSYSPLRDPEHTRENSQHSGFSDAGYHSLVPSRSPTASYSTSSLDTSSLGLVGSNNSNNCSNVWNVRATSASMSPRLSPRHKAAGGQPSTTHRTRIIKQCHFDRLSDSVLVKIFSYLTSLDIVNVSQTCKRLYFLSWEPDLWTSLTLTSSMVETDRALRSIVEVLSRNSGMDGLQRVCLNGSPRLTDRGLALLARRACQLRQLEVQHCPGVTNGGLLDLVSRCPQLNHLDLTGCPMVTTVCLPASPLRPRPALSLQYLDLSDCNGVDDTSVRLAVENCPQLQFLFLRRLASVTDLSLKCIASYCLMLRELSISDCSRITDTGLTHLAKLGPSLRYLSVAKCYALTDSGVKQLVRHCYKLRYLNLRGCELISDLAVEALSKSCSRLRSLDLGKCDVTDLGLRDLSLNCPNLKKLSVRGCEMVTDQGLTNIAYYCRGLQQLNIQDVVGVTCEGYRNVKKYCRKCIIEHTNPGLA